MAFVNVRFYTAPFQHNPFLPLIMTHGVERCVGKPGFSTGYSNIGRFSKPLKNRQIEKGKKRLLVSLLNKEFVV
jgi:transposase InsO family protein